MFCFGFCCEQRLAGVSRTNLCKNLNKSVNFSQKSRFALVFHAQSLQNLDKSVNFSQKSRFQLWGGSLFFFLHFLCPR